MTMQTASRKIINGWALYDWANSVYSLVIVSTIFPSYYEAITGDGNENTLNDTVQIFGTTFINTSLYNFSLAAGFLVVAMLSPLLSSIADTRGNKKQFLMFFCSLGSTACAGLYFFSTKEQLAYGLLCMTIACIGFWGSIVFYNSYLPEIAAPSDRDKVSARGFAMGYIGSVLLQLISFAFVMFPDIFHMTIGSASRFSFLMVGVWWLSFGFLAISMLPAGKKSEKKTDGHILLTGYHELHIVWRQLISNPVLKKFLFAFFFYNMGVQTVMLAATLYGKSELNIPTTNLIAAILLIQLVAIPGAYLIASLSKAWGNFKALALTISIWALICIAGYFVPRNGIYEFYGIAIAVGFVMGGIQSLSRSTFAKLMPDTPDTASFFSFYDVTEKIAIVIGMFSFGYINEITGSQRGAVLALIIFFMIGLAILFSAMRKENIFASDNFFAARKAGNQP